MSSYFDLTTTDTIKQLQVQLHWQEIRTETVNLPTLLFSLTQKKLYQDIVAYGYMISKDQNRSGSSA